jgi:hypothetical protein
MNVYERIWLMSQIQEQIQAGKRPLFLVLCFLLFLCRCLHAEPAITNAKGEFVFRYENAGKIRNIKVYYCAPEKLTKSSRIVFVLHGANRNGARYRDEWQKHARQYKFLVLCPELSESDFSYWEYNCGNIYNEKESRYNRKEEWTFNLIEQLFDFVKQDKQMIVGSYCIFGHSAGAQFVQRMVLFMPEARFSLAIANGAGSYTLPNFEINFVNGLKHTPVTEDGLKKAFEKNLIILMGEKDFVTEKRPASYAETTHKWDRVWRAQFFYEEAKTKSEQMEVKLNWIYKTVPGADHNNPKHSLWASKYAAKSQKNIISKVQQDE